MDMQYIMSLKDAYVSASCGHMCFYETTHEKRKTFEIKNT